MRSVDASDAVICLWLATKKVTGRTPKVGSSSGSLSHMGSRNTKSWLKPLLQILGVVGKKGILQRSTKYVYLLYKIFRYINAVFKHICWNSRSIEQIDILKLDIFIYKGNSFGQDPIYQTQQAPHFGGFRWLGRMKSPKCNGMKTSAGFSPAPRNPAWRVGFILGKQGDRHI